MSIKIPIMTPYKLFMSSIGIIYVWSLPFLSKIGFSESGSTSISQFISNPPATGAMAFVSFMPITLLWQYQDFIISKKNSFYKPLYYSLCLFQFFYGSFLVCTENYAPLWLHKITVVLFGLSYITHAGMILKYVEPCNIASTTLIIGIGSFISLIFVKGMWFWAMESLGFSALLLFTPIELYMRR